MFPVLLNEDQTPGFLAKARPPLLLFHSVQRDSRDWRTSSTSRVEDFFFFPSLPYTSPFFLTLPFYNQPLQHPERPRVSEWVHQFISPDESGLWSLFINTLGRWEVYLWKKRDTTQETHPRGVRLGLDWTQTLKLVYVNKWQGEGSGQMSGKRGGGRKPLTPVVKSKANRKHLCQCSRFLSRGHIWWINLGRQRPSVVSLLSLDAIDPFSSETLHFCQIAVSGNFHFYMTLREILFLSG